MDQPCALPDGALPRDGGSVKFPPLRYYGSIFRAKSLLHYCGPSQDQEKGGLGIWSTPHKGLLKSSSPASTSWTAHRAPRRVVQSPLADKERRLVRRRQPEFVQVLFRCLLRTSHTRHSLNMLGAMGLPRPRIQHPSPEGPYKRHGRPARKPPPAVIGMSIPQEGGMWSRSPARPV